MDITLSAQQRRELAQMYTTGGYSVRDLADHLGVSGARVRRELRRALAEALEALDAQENA